MQGATIGHRTPGQRPPGTTQRPILPSTHHPAPLSGGGLPVEEQHLQLFFEEGFIMEAAAPALAPVGAGEGDVLSVRRPAYLVALHLHVFDEALPAGGVFQCLVDGLLMAWMRSSFQLSPRSPAWYSPGFMRFFLVHSSHSSSTCRL